MNVYQPCQRHRRKAVQRCPIIAGVVATGEKLSQVTTIPAKNLSPFFNPCHGFSVIAGVVDTGNKFITGVVDTGDQLSQVTRTLVNNYHR
jgi:hypothetical protein